MKIIHEGLLENVQPFTAPLVTIYLLLKKFLELSALLNAKHHEASVVSEPL